MSQPLAAPFSVAPFWLPMLAIGLAVPLAFVILALCDRFALNRARRGGSVALDPCRRAREAGPEDGLEGIGDRSAPNEFNH